MVIFSKLEEFTIDINEAQKFVVKNLEKIAEGIKNYYYIKG